MDEREIGRDQNNEWMDSLERGEAKRCLFSVDANGAKALFLYFVWPKESRGSGNIYTKTDNKIMNDDDVLIKEVRCVDGLLLMAE